jgi:hypothetical protein
MLQKILGTFETDAAICPAAARAVADFRRDLSAAFDATMSKQRLLDRARPRWTRNWSAAQCAEVAELRKSVPVDMSSTTDTFAAFLDRWLHSPEAAPTLRDQKIAKRIRDTLIDVKKELDAAAHEANDALRRALPPIIQRDKAATMAAIDVCIAAEEARLAAEPATAAPAARTPDRTPTEKPAEKEKAPAPVAAAVLSIDPPAPFVVTHDTSGLIEVLKINSSTGQPVPGEADGSLCQAMFVENPSNAAHSQDFLNERMSKTDSRTAAGAMSPRSLEIRPGQLFDRLGIRGLEFVAKQQPPAGAAQMLIYVAMLETPKGGAYLRCVTPEKGFAEALTHLHAIRDSITPPR